MSTIYFSCGQMKGILTFSVEFVQFNHKSPLLIRGKTVSKFIVLRSQEDTDGGVFSCSSAVINIDDKAERFVFQMMIFHLSQKKINFHLMYCLHLIIMNIIHKLIKDNFI